MLVGIQMVCKLCVRLLDSYRLFLIFVIDYGCRNK
ncbi:hypothetical protein immuto35A_8 [Flavobacterium phage vB_FspM_immuto_3-5A]|uniref:Uncharacterized protein n=1 Tax=Flavobacterium phage vB_FspM_immuto_2-6A TaxID=2801477 RepID=A0A7T8ER61_9CAUD|nr:hypothetical protein KNV73_gp008 [Flavobacterium phage vB_FspM_immuto_2-6A]QQO91687.1 hypothetical protein immuto26A_8 [Flavobacterium phage vB_FspM_immuto_2-6A]QQO91926.1 hypothetical protein immuto35A_8 [Flavobacterium phage vB_FspM_immuto_3-5A]QQO92164.1 hypothetical protein immuto136C_8 [Flavobacterium phage vB_FspM_immuto_13-6C]